MVRGPLAAKTSFLFLMAAAGVRGGSVREDAGTAAASMVSKVETGTESQARVNSSRRTSIRAAGEAGDAAGGGGEGGVGGERSSTLKKRTCFGKGLAFGGWRRGQEGGRGGRACGFEESGAGLKPWFRHRFAFSSWAFCVLQWWPVRLSTRDCPGCSVHIRECLSQRWFVPGACNSSSDLVFIKSFESRRARWPRRHKHVCSE